MARIHDEFTEALDWYAQQPCHECGEPLGKYWAEKYYAADDRMWKVHRCHV